MQSLVFYTWSVRGLADVAAYFGAVERMQFFNDTLPKEKVCVCMCVSVCLCVYGVTEYEMGKQNLKEGDAEIEGDVR